MSEVTDTNPSLFYQNGANYWSEIPATLDGMLGGFANISQTDIKGSKLLLKQLFNSKKPPGRKCALDCGAGIGRITKFLLTDFFEKVDLVEQNATFIEQAKKYMGHKSNRVGCYYTVGLQDFEPVPNKYDLIWIQWVVGHLTNEDLVDFLKRCRNGLKENGMIILKENVTSSNEVELDRNDSSVTRPMYLLREIIKEADLECYRVTKQHDFPKALYSVYMFILKPKISEICDELVYQDVQQNCDNSSISEQPALDNIESVDKKS
nr:unnamed protein product [Callosobruchus analis]CAI5850837.1 unnamed protein product [Callosobruchus analis]